MIGGVLSLIIQIPKFNICGNGVLLSIDFYVLLKSQIPKKRFFYYAYSINFKQKCQNR